MKFADLVGLCESDIRDDLFQNVVLKDPNKTLKYAEILIANNKPIPKPLWEQIEKAMILAGFYAATAFSKTLVELAEKYIDENEKIPAELLPIALYNDSIKSTQTYQNAQILAIKYIENNKEKEIPPIILVKLSQAHYAYSALDAYLRNKKPVPDILLKSYSKDDAYRDALISLYNNYQMPVPKILKKINKKI